VGKGKKNNFKRGHQPTGKEMRRGGKNLKSDRAYVFDVSREKKLTSRSKKILTKKAERYRREPGDVSKWALMEPFSARV